MCTFLGKTGKAQKSVSQKKKKKEIIISVSYQCHLRGSHQNKNFTITLMREIELVNPFYMYN